MPAKLSKLRKKLVVSTPGGVKGRFPRTPEGYRRAHGQLAILRRAHRREKHGS